MDNSSELTVYEQMASVLDSALDLTKEISDNPLVQAIPIFGKICTVLKMSKAVGDKLFEKKIERFVFSFYGLPDTTVDQMRKKLIASENDKSRVAEMLLTVLENISDAKKADVLADIFLAYIDSVISIDEMRRLSQSLTSAFVDDVICLIEANEVGNKIETGWMQNLSMSGLTVAVSGQSWDGAGKIYYDLTEAGKSMRAAGQHAKTMRNNEL